MIADNLTHTVLFEKGEIGMRQVKGIREKYDVVIYFDIGGVVKIVFKNDTEFMEFLLTHE